VIIPASILLAVAIVSAANGVRIELRDVERGRIAEEMHKRIENEVLRLNSDIGPDMTMGDIIKAKRIVSQLKADFEKIPNASMANGVSFSDMWELEDFLGKMEALIGLHEMAVKRRNSR
jgi:hypothetical protein